MANFRTKVFHLEMEGEHYYFGSPKAMFDIMGEEKMGMRYASFHSNISLKVGDVYQNRRHGYIIRVGILGQAKTNRGNKLEDRINERVAAALAERGMNDVAPAQEAPVAAPVEAAPAMPAVEAPAAPIAETPATPIVENATVETPAQNDLFADQPEFAPAEPATPKKKGKKKNADIPEQLTLF